MGVMEDLVGPIADDSFVQSLCLELDQNPYAWRSVSRALRNVLERPKDFHVRLLRFFRRKSASVEAESEKS